MGSTAGTGDGTGRGNRGQRRRGDELYAAIFEATLAELGEVGYTRMVIERIATRAGASKASIYRHWPTRAELVRAALRHHYRTPEALPDTGNLRDDALALLRLGAERLNGVFGEAARGLVAESLTDPDSASLRASMFLARNRLMGEILERAAARGEISPAAITPHAIEVAPALVDHHFLMRGTPIPDELLTGIVDDILLPLVTATCGTAAVRQRSRRPDPRPPTPGAS